MRTVTINIYSFEELHETLQEDIITEYILCSEDERTPDEWRRLLINDADNWYTEQGERFYL